MTGKLKPRTGTLKIQKITFKNKYWYNKNSINTKENNRNKNKDSNNNDKL